MIDKSDGAGFKWWGTSVQIPYTTQVCYRSEPSGWHYTSRQTQDGTGYKGGVNVGGTACFTVTEGNSWTTGEIEAYKNECPEEENCEQLYYRESCVNRTDIVPTAVPAVAWWQVKDADITTNGNISSKIPSGCTLPTCNPSFDLDGAGGYPGIPSYVGSYDFNQGAGRGKVSSKGWQADSQTIFKKVYDYAFFNSQIPVDVQAAINEISSPSISGNSLASGGVSSRGYFWYHFDGSTLGDLTLNGNLTIPASRKIILLVESGDLLINGRINIVSPGQGFFMTVVGKTQSGARGDIIVSPSVSHPTQPSLEGIFLSEGTFSTGSWGGGLDTKLIIRGSVAAYGGITLQRDLGSSRNSTSSSELFEYAPELMLLFPDAFTARKMRWKEEAP